MLVSKLAVAPVTGSNTFEISMDVYYDPATLNTSAYHNFINGRGNNTGFHSGMMIPGVLNENAFEGRWRLQNTGSTISKTGLTADWYRYSMIVTATTFQIKLLNLRTNVLLEGSAVAIGTVDNADNFAYTALCYGISGTTGAYGTVGVNFSNFRITRSGVTLVNLPFSSGAGTQVVNVYSGAVYNLAFFTASTGWAKLSDYCHYNFVNGFTLYQKDANPDLRIPNKIDGTEITITPPTGYTRIKNYGPSLLTFNQCESRVKLDDVEPPVMDLVVSGAGDAVLNGVYPMRGTYSGKPYYYNNTLTLAPYKYSHFFNWDGVRWNWGGAEGVVYMYSYEDVATPDLVTSWTLNVGNLPVGSFSHSIAETVYVTGGSSPSGYTGKYHNVGVWADNDLYEKVDDVNKQIWKSAAPWDIYGWTIGEMAAQGYWYEYVNGNGNADTPKPYDVDIFSPFSLVGATGNATVELSEGHPLYVADIDHVLFTDGTGVAKEFFISDIKIEEGIDRGYLYINEDIEQKDFMLYGSDKTLLDDFKVIKFVGQEGRVSYDEEGVPNYDENNHVELGE